MGMKCMDSFGINQKGPVVRHFNLCCVFVWLEFIWFGFVRRTLGLRT